MSLAEIESRFSLLGLDQISHHEGSLLNHLRNVANFMQQWGFDDEAVEAAFCHSLFGTTYFKRAPISRAEAEKWKSHLRPNVLNLVRTFRSMNRKMFLTMMESLVTNPFFSPEIWNVETQQLESTSRENAIVLLHLLLANSLDHERGSPGSRQWFRALNFQKVMSLLRTPAQSSMLATYPYLRITKPKVLLLLHRQVTSFEVLDALLTAGCDVSVVSFVVLPERFRRVVRAFGYNQIQNVISASWPMIVDFRPLDDLARPGIQIRERHLQVGALVDECDSSRFLQGLIFLAFQTPCEERVSQMIGPYTLERDLIKVVLQEVQALPSQTPDIQLMRNEKLTLEDVYHSCQNPTIINATSPLLLTYIAKTYQRL